MKAETDSNRTKVATPSGPPTIRPATVEDARTLATLIDLASEGLPHRIWKSHAPRGADPRHFGAEVAAGRSGNFSWRNVRLVQDRVFGKSPGQGFV